MISRYHHPGPQTCCHPTHGPGATREGSRRQMAEAGGSRRKLTEAAKWHKQRYGRSIPPGNLVRGMLGFQIFSPDVAILAPTHVAISHTDKRRSETDADGTWRTMAAAGGSRRKMGNGRNIMRICLLFRKFTPVPVGFPDVIPRRHHGRKTCFHRTDGPSATAEGRWRNLQESDGRRKWHKQR